MSRHVLTFAVIVLIYVLSAAIGYAVDLPFLFGAAAAMISDAWSDARNPR